MKTKVFGYKIWNMKWKIKYWVKNSGILNMKYKVFGYKIWDLGYEFKYRVFG